MSTHPRNPQHLRRTLRVALVALAIAGVLGCETRAAPATKSDARIDTRLKIFVGAASKPPTEEIVALFEAQTGVTVDAVFGGSGFALSQMVLAGDGDVYFPGSSDFMEKARRAGHVDGETEKIAAYLVSAINVQRGNPKQIETLHDLLRPDVRVAIANPETVCVGTYAVEIVEQAFSPAERDAFRDKLVNYTQSCETTATAVSLESVDAVIGWRVFEHWDPKRIESIALPAAQIHRIGYIPLAVSSFSNNRELAQQFVDFVASEQGRAVFRRHHYFTTVDEARHYVGEPKPVGGEYELPQRYRPN